MSRIVSKTCSTLSLGVGLVLLPGCLSSKTDEEPETFIVFQSDFEGWEDWESWQVGTDEIAPGHLDGPRYVYINEVPPPDSDHFPVGTIIIKTAPTSDDPTEWTVFAAVKRGGDYNLDGAVDWEWFGLDISETGNLLVEWRGPEPPADSNYLGHLGDEAATATSCNDCHMGAADNDYIFSGPLQLSGF